MSLFQIPANIHVWFLTHCYCIIIVLPSLVYLYFKLDIENDEIRKALLVKQGTEWIEWFCTFLLIPSVL